MPLPDGYELRVWSRRCKTAFNTSFRFLLVLQADVLFRLAGVRKILRYIWRVSDGHAYSDLSAVSVMHELF